MSDYSDIKIKEGCDLDKVNYKVSKLRNKDENERRHCPHYHRNGGSLDEVRVAAIDALLVLVV